MSSQNESYTFNMSFKVYTYLLLISNFYLYIVHNDTTVTVKRYVLLQTEEEPVRSVRKDRRGRLVPSATSALKNNTQVHTFLPCLNLAKFWQ